MNFLVFLFLVICYNNVRCDATDNCNFGTCGACISYAHETCVWCTQDVVKDRRCRPLSYANTMKTWCDKAFLMHGSNSTKTVVENKGFNETKAGFPIQLRPQKIHIKARPELRNGIDFKMTYKAAQHYPLDVYFLMDISYTMKSNVKMLKKQALEIYNDLSHYTNNVTLGFGGFVEKQAFPFFDPNLHKGETFSNFASLTNNMSRFTEAIDKIKDEMFGSNYDDPEAGLDALMQTMTCEKDLGWRTGARRIIVFCSDSPYHSAGDGKIVGAVKPNDMKCHLKDNNYTMALTLDYPSVSQIKKVAKDGDFLIIFAVAYNSYTKNTPEAEYKALAKQILGAKSVKLEKGSGVLKIIKEAYEALTNTVKLNSDAPDFVQLTIHQDCNVNPKINCENIHNQVTKISANLKVKYCPADSNLTHRFDISVNGLGNAPLTIELEIDCKCDCEMEKPTNGTNPKCNNAGYIQCGICKCLPGSYGSDCQCSGKSTDYADEAKCKYNDDTKPCSGKAECICGKCGTCEPGFSGDFCEFDDTSCAKGLNNKICSDNGICTRGRCECSNGWTQQNCSCPATNKGCIAPYSDMVCSGNGLCSCGRCYCNKLEGKDESYTGMFCDNCKECGERRCKQLEDYAYCNYMNMDNKPFCDKHGHTNGTTTDNIIIVFVNNTEINDPQWYMAKWCKKELENGTFVFKYLYENHDLKLVIQKELEVPPKANIWIAAGSAIGLVLLIGLLTVIIWKILVDKYDQREYNKFANDAAAAGYDVSVNVLYQEPGNTFANPAYNDCH